MTKFALTKNQSIAAPKQPTPSEVKTHLECEGSVLNPIAGGMWQCDKCFKVGYAVRKVLKAPAKKS